MKRILILFLISITLTPLFAGPRERNIVYETGRVFFSAYDAMESARSQAETFIQTYELLSPSWQEKTYDSYIAILEKSFGKEIAASIRSEMEWNIWNGNFENMVLHDFCLIHLAFFCKLVPAYNQINFVI